jgi:hypothetical protein
MSRRYTKWLSNIPNGHNKYQNFSFQGTPNYSQIGILGLKIYHLAPVEATYLV